MKINKKPPLFIVGEGIDSEALKSVEALGFKAILLPCDNRLPPPTQSHADTLMLLIENNVFCNELYLRKSASVFSQIEGYGYNIVPCAFEVKSSYPHDIALNQAKIGKYIIGNENYCAKKAFDFIKAHDYAYIHTRQGYAKCSTLILNEKAIVTADDSIIEIAKRLDIEYLRIKNAPNNVSLQGYDYGFIGGASAVYDSSVLFFGNLSLHENGEEIASFCKKHGFSVASLTKNRLTDVGGAFILPYINN